MGQVLEPIVTEEDFLDGIPFADEPQSNGSEMVAVEEEKTIAYMNPNEVPDLDNMNEGMNIAPQYWEVENRGESKRGVYIAKSTLNGQNGVVPMVVLQNRDGIWTSAATNLVQQIFNMPFGTCVQATYEGKEKTGKGFMVKKFTVKLLNEKPALNVPNVPAGIPSMRK
jgi:hypothetical protein